MSNRLYSTELQHGETYKTTTTSTWGDWDNGNEHVTVPANTQLIFRSFQDFYDEFEEEPCQLALFVWLEKRKTICLLVRTEKCYFDLEHVEWNKREEIASKS